LEINFVFRRVRDEVMKLTSGEQVPHVYGSLGGEPIYLKPSASLPPTTPVKPVASEANPPVKLTITDVTKLFGRFNKIFEMVQKNYVEKPDDKQLITVAIQSMSKAFPIAVTDFGAGQIGPNPINFNETSTTDLNDLYHAAMPILEVHQTSGDDVRLVDAAIKGMLGSLDPRSYYLDAKSFSEAQTQSRGQFGGVGITLRMVDGLAMVVAVIDDSPAARAGIVGGDVITHLDDQPLHGLTLDQIGHKMRGPVNTSITLTIVRKGKDEAFNAKIMRDVIRINAVKARLENDVIYVKISAFNEETNANLVKEVENLKKSAGKTIKGYVVDLRNNLGGLFDQAIAVADDFIEKGEIVSTKGRNLEETQRFNARAGTKISDGKPIVVLINGGSASASEIVAGALQDHKRATIVGTRSFGLGSIQTLFPLGPGEGALRLTTSHYFTPSSRSIHAKGIVPDVEVLQDVPEDIKARGGGETKGESGLAASQSYVPPDPHEDKALILALELIRGTKTSKEFPNLPAEAQPSMVKPPEMPENKIYTYLNLVGDVFERLRADANISDGVLIKSAIDAMLDEFPSRTIKSFAYRRLNDSTMSKGASSVYRSLDLFGDVLERLRNENTGPEKDRRLIQAALNGMLKSVPLRADIRDALESLIKKSNLFQIVTEREKMRVLTK
jgi:carboxyl-terminal processing protease